MGHVVSRDENIITSQLRRGFDVVRARVNLPKGNHALLSPILPHGILLENWLLWQETSEILPRQLCQKAGSFTNKLARLLTSAAGCSSHKKPRNDCPDINQSRRICIIVLLRQVLETIRLNATVASFPDEGTKFLWDMVGQWILPVYLCTFVVSRT